MDPIVSELLRAGGLGVFAAFLAWQNHSLFARVINALEETARANEALAQQIARAIGVKDGG